MSHVYPNYTSLIAQNEGREISYRDNESAREIEASFIIQTLLLVVKINIADMWILINKV